MEELNLLDIQFCLKTEPVIQEVSLVVYGVSVSVEPVHVVSFLLIHKQIGM